MSIESPDELIALRNVGRICHLALREMAEHVRAGITTAELADVGTKVMRENGARSLLVTCSNVTCRHEKIVNVDAYDDDLFVPSFGPRMRCEKCGQCGADVRPNWNEQAPPSLFGVP